jgi:alpha-tubulin suppressor-like RCC1 family protein
VKQVAIGIDHGCALTGDERVSCWRRRLDPPEDGEVVAVVGVRKPRRISGEGCAVESDGHVVCWPTWRAPGDAKAPEARRIDANGDFEDVAGSAASGCAKRRDGTIWCWGDDTYGQAGQAPPRAVPAPAEVRGVESATLVALGAHHACALVADGDVLCWGDDSGGQLGDHDCHGAPWTEAPKKAGACVREKPARVPGVPPATQITAGRAHTCALARDGRAYCWGTYVTRGAGERAVVP